MRFMKPDDNTTDLAAVEVLNVVLRLANLISAREDGATYGSKSTFFLHLNNSLAGLMDVSTSNILVKLQSPKYAQGLLQVYPWTPISRSRYKVIRQCFTERFPAVLDPSEMQVVYKLPDVVNRDIYEHVAVSMAHLEFREGVRRLSNNFSDYRLATAQHWSSDKLFFVYYAESKCEKYDEEWNFREFVRRKESPMAQRVNLALSHDETFHRAFGCRRGLGMRPSRRCSFW
ncbi:unnamed protein product [Ixodes hexagonus]